MTAPVILLVSLGPVLWLLLWARRERGRFEAYVDPEDVAFWAAVRATENDPGTVAALEQWQQAQHRLATGKPARIDITYPPTVLERAS